MGREKMQMADDNGSEKRHFILAMKSLLNDPTNKKEITSCCVTQGAQVSAM